MKPYLDLLQYVLRNGSVQKNRTGVPTLMVPGYMMQFDCDEYFPAMTTKRLAFKAVVGELIGFIRGYTSAAQFRSLGCNIWDANANANKDWLASPFRAGADDLGHIYGYQWRHWGAEWLNTGDGTDDGIDQLRLVVNHLCDPVTSQSRRLIVTSWDPLQLPYMALPPCHLLYQFLVTQETSELNMCVYMRSIDSFLGLPFNIASYALLLRLVARATGWQPGLLTMFLADLHIYTNHTTQVEIQLSREPRQLPRVILPTFNPDVKTPMQYLEELVPEDISLFGYDPHPAISAPMAV